MINTNPQSEVKCCEKCFYLRDIHNARAIPSCRDEQCPCHHPKESPVSQSVEGWEKRLRDGLSDEIRTLVRMTNLMSPKTDAELIAVALPNLNIFVHGFISSTLSTLVKEMEGIKEETRNFPMKSDGGNWDEWNDGYDKGISAAVEVVKKMV